MGTILAGYGEAGYDHVGYPAQVLDDGSITGSYTDQTRPRMVGALVAACECGWAGITSYPTTTLFDEHAQALALAEWEHTHARPALHHDQQQRTIRLQELLHRAEEHGGGLQVAGPGPYNDQQQRTIRLRELLHRAGEHGGGLPVPGPGPYRLSLLIGALREALDLACALRDHDPAHPTT